MCISGGIGKKEFIKCIDGNCQGECFPTNKNGAFEVRCTVCGALIDTLMNTVKQHGNPKLATTPILKEAIS